MRAKKGYVLTMVSISRRQLFVLSTHRTWKLSDPRIFASRPEAARQLAERKKRYQVGNLILKVMSYRDWEKKAVEQEISR